MVLSVEDAKRKLISSLRNSLSVVKEINIEEDVSNFVESNNYNFNESVDYNKQSFLKYIAVQKI
jgi:hypothetical protein